MLKGLVLLNWFRRSLAAALAPELAHDAERYHHLRGQVETYRWWLSEFPPAFKALSWILQRDHNHWRALDDQNQILLPESIEDFRKHLRDQAAAPARPGICVIIRTLRGNLPCA